MHRLRQAHPNDRRSIEALLIAEHLPVEDVGSELAQFIVAEDGNRVVGIGALEPIDGRNGFLRSIAVLPAYRRRGIAKEIVTRLMQRARQEGLAELYLFTVSAQDYFAKQGFSVVPRAAAPDAVRRTRQFAALCPCTVVLMRRTLSNG